VRTFVLALLITSCATTPPIVIPQDAVQIAPDVLEQRVAPRDPFRMSLFPPSSR
jgi:hypothetical protein